MYGKCLGTDKPGCISIDSGKVRANEDFRFYFDRVGVLAQDSAIRRAIDSIHTDMTKQEDVGVVLDVNGDGEPKKGAFLNSEASQRT
jgi:hypothetical protein